MWVAVAAAACVMSGGAAASGSPARACTATSDVVVWGGTVCGVTAAVAAHRSDPSLSITWLVNGTRLGQCPPPAPPETPPSTPVRCGALGGCRVAALELAVGARPRALPWHRAVPFHRRLRLHFRLRGRCTADARFHLTLAACARVPACLPACLPAALLGGMTSGGLGGVDRSMARTPMPARPFLLPVAALCVLCCAVLCRGGGGSGLTDTERRTYPTCPACLT